MPIISEPVTPTGSVTVAAASATVKQIPSEGAEYVNVVVKNTGGNPLDAAAGGGDLEGSLDGSLWFTLDSSARGLASGAKINITVSPCLWRQLRFVASSAAGTTLTGVFYTIPWPHLAE